SFAQEAVLAVIEDLAAIFETMEDEYFRLRAGDVRDEGWRLGRALSGAAPTRPPAGGPWVIVAADITPSQTAEVDLGAAAGIVTEGGGAMSHAAILARARRLPAVWGTGPLRDRVQAGDLVIVDGTAGEVILRPDAATVERYRRRQAAVQVTVEEARPDPTPAATGDGHPIVVAANISVTDEALLAARMGADGVGLVRTEFLFMNRSAPPSEEEQVNAYRRVVAALGDRPVVFRTVDVGGDKPAPALGIHPEPNPFLGWRGIRYCLDRPDVFKTQLRALWQATTGELWVMFPMVSDPEEVERARELLEEAREELVAQGRPVARAARVGMMVETPAAALALDRFVPWVDFFSVGTNDLIQYLLGVDRGNPKVSRWYRPTAPAVLATVAQVLEAAQRTGRWATVCGEMAADPPLAAFLVGMGAQELSVAPAHVARVKRLVRALRRDEARAAAMEALKAPNAEKSWAVLEEYRRSAESRAAGNAAGQS